MGAFVVYTLKCFFCLSFVYFFHKMLLGRETFHRANRITWLLLIPLSLLLPLCGSDAFGNLFAEAATLPEGTGSHLSDEMIGLVVSGFDSRTIWLLRGLAGLYFVGLFVVAIRIGYGYIRILHLIVSGKKIGVISQPGASEVEKVAFDLLEQNRQVIGLRRNVYVILCREPVIPFSWLNFIVIGEEDLMEGGTGIFRHELFHIQKRHTWDVMLADLLVIYQWFNPAAWLLKHSLQQVHEFQADEAVLRSGLQAKDYQLLLLQKAVGRRLFSMANGFNYSRLKNRIGMMLKEKSSKWAYVKYLYILPLAFAFASAYASESVLRRLGQIEHSFVSIPNSEQKDTLAKPAERGAKMVIRGENSPLFIYDGKELGGMETIDPNNIAYITVLKDTSATAQYGERGKNGVIWIVSKEKNAKK